MEPRVDELLIHPEPALPWRERVRRALYALHRFLAADERAAELLLVELGLVADSDHPVAERWTEALFDLIDEGREEPTAPAGLGRMTAEALAGGVCTRLYAAVVRDGRLPDEAEIVPELMYCVVLPYFGRDPAASQRALSSRPALGGGKLGHGRNLALGFLVGNLALDADQQLLVQHREDAFQDGNRRHVVAPLDFRDEGVRGSRSFGDLLLRQVKLVAPLAYVGGDPVPLAQLADRGILVASLSISLAAPCAAPCRKGGGPALRVDATILFRAHDQIVYPYR
jgi:hypothetical protein